MQTSKLLSIGVLALGLGMAPAEAGPSAAQTAVAAPESGIVKVYRRGNFGVGLGLGIIGGAIIANEAYRPRRGYYYDDYTYDGPYYFPSGYRGDPRVVCAENFRSFEWRTGLYTTYSGEKRLCPYLN